MKLENVIHVGMILENVEYVIYVGMKSEIRKCYMLRKLKFIFIKSKFMLNMLIKIG